MRNRRVSSYQMKHHPRRVSYPQIRYVYRMKLFLYEIVWYEIIQIYEDDLWLQTSGTIKLISKWW